MEAGVAEGTKPVISEEAGKPEIPAAEEKTAETISAETAAEKETKEVEAQEQKPQEKSPEGAPKAPELTERERQYQANQDRAEAQLKNLYKQLLPFVDIDANGNIVGLKNQTNTPPVDVDALMEAAIITGDKEALKQLFAMNKQETINEGIKQIQQTIAIEKELLALRKEYKNLYKEDGSLNYDDPLFIETAKVLEKAPELSHPLKVRTAIEIAEGRMLKRGLPNIQQQIKNEAQTRLKNNMASTTVVGTQGKPAIPAEYLMSEAHINQLKREGYDQAGIDRIQKIYAQAKKEGSTKSYVID